MGSRTSPSLPQKKINRGQPIKMSGFTVRTTYLLLELYPFKNTGEIDPFELWNALSRLRENEFSKSVLPAPPPKKKIETTFCRSVIFASKST